MTKTSNKNTPESHGNGDRINERTRKGENIRLRHKNGLETKIGGNEMQKKQAMCEWHEMEKELPVENVYVLVVRRDLTEYMEVAVRRGEMFWHCDGEYGSPIDDFSHWTMLPPSPSKTTEEGDE